MPNPVRIARVITRLNIGGPARHVDILCTDLSSRFSTVLYTGRTGTGEGEMTSAHHRVEIVPGLAREVTPIGDAQALWHLIRAFQGTRPQIVHTHTAKAGTLGRVAARLTRTPLVVHTYHGHSLKGYFGPLKQRLYLEIERYLARHTDALIAVSSAVKDELMTMGIGSEHKWRVIPLGLKLDELLGSTRDTTSSRRSLGLPVQGPVVGIVGRLTAIKDHATFLAAASLIARKTEASFAIVGDGDLRSELEKMAQRLGVGSKVRFLGWVKDLPALYSSLDVVVLTSRNEGTPVALIEAMAAGRPVVSTAVGGVPDCVPPQAGILVPPGNPGSICQAVVEILEDEAIARKMGVSGQEWVADRYSSQRLVTDVQALYEELLGKEGR